MIALKHISKSYGEKKILDDFSMEIPEGRTTCIMGRSGAGKTTLLRILMGLEKPDEGEIKTDRPYKKSAVFQEDRLCGNLSVLANIRLVCPGRSRGQIIEEMERTGLCGCENQLVNELSGGMKRRTAILRALLAEYDLLFLDEPFKGLDEETKQRTMEFVREKSRGKTVLFVTHDAKEARQMGAENIVHIDTV